MAEQEAFARAEDAALRALALDPESGEALTSLGGVQLARGHFGPAEEAFRRAIEVGRSSADTHHWYAFLLATLGRLDESLREMDLAHELDPLSMAVLTSEARVLMLAGKLDAGVGVLESAIDLEPTYPWTHLLLAGARVRQRRLDDARLEAEAALRELPSEARARATLAALQALTGDEAAAREVLVRLARESEDESRPATVGFSVAVIHAALGETDMAFQVLENLTWNSELLFSLQGDPFLDPLRADPRYPALLRRLGLGGRNLAP
jgi:tetratricopeptide (TPR) repeat protein